MGHIADAIMTTILRSPLVQRLSHVWISSAGF